MTALIRGRTGAAKIGAAAKTGATSQAGAEPDFWTQLAWISAGASPLLAWRRAARLSVFDLSELSGVPMATITAIEARAHRPSRLELVALAATLGLGPGDLED